MLDQSPFAPRSVTCLVHRKEKATHICTDLNCQQNPILCNQCINDSRWRVQHPHENAVRPLNQGVQWLSGVIRSQSKSIELIYQRTIGSRDCELIKFNIEKGSLLNEQLDNRLQNLRIQLQLEMELLMKQFQKQIQIQKQQFSRKLEQYRKLFGSNIQYIKKDCLELINFQNSLKFYNNPNNLTLKLITETERKSHDWIQQQKKILLKVTQMLQNSSYSNSLTLMLNRANKSNLMMLPSWKGQKRELQMQKQMKNSIRTAMSSWMQIPQLVDLQQIRGNQYSSSNKYIAYPIVA